MRFEPPSIVRRATALVALLLVCATALPPVIHADMDDLACELGAVPGGGRTALEEHGASSQSTHCDVCHWLQSARACFVVHQRLPQLQPVTASVRVTPESDVAAPGLPRRPSRAPPAA